MDLDPRHLFRNRAQDPEKASILPRRAPAPSNVANIGNEIYDSMLLKEKTRLRPPVIMEEPEPVTKPERRPGQSVYAGSLEP